MRDLCKEFLYSFLNASSDGSIENELIKRPVEKEVINAIEKIIEKRLKTTYNPSGNYGNSCFSDKNGYYERSGFIKETEEYNCDDIAAVILKYSEKNKINIPFGLTMGKNNNVVIYKLVEE